MFTRRRVLIALIVVASLSLVAAYRGYQHAAAGTASFPLVLRIDAAILDEVTRKNIDERRPVNQMLFGTHAVGETHIVGTVSSALLPDSTVALFAIRFQGQSVTKTVGHHEPAVVYSHSTTDFTCTRHVTFDPRVGFVPVGEIEVLTNTRLNYDGFGATQQFGHRIIERVAERRSADEQEKYRRHADMDNQRGLREGFEKCSSEQLAEANKQVDTVRYVNRFLDKSSPLQLCAKSSTDCVHIGVGFDGHKYCAMNELPALREKSAPYEVWVNVSILGAPVTALLPESRTILPPSLQAKILEALSIPAAAPDASMHLGFEQGWLVLELPMPEPPKVAVATSQHSR